MAPWALSPGTVLQCNMVGIDLTRISRFETMPLGRLGKFLGQDLDTPCTAAKVWCCHEALVKAKGKTFNFKKVKLVFKPNQRPQVNDPENILSGNYVLSLSHEGDLVTAVAFRIGP